MGNFVIAFIGELKRRKVLRVGAIYLAAAWFIIQATDILHEPLGLGERSVLVVTIFLIVGFPVAVVLTWLFDLQDTGELKPDEGSARLVTTSIPARASFALGLLSGMGMLAIVGWITVRSPVEEGMLYDHVAVLYFADRTSDRRLEHLAPAVTEALIAKLSEVRALTVVSSNGVGRYVNQQPPLDSLARLLHVGTVVSGSVSGSGNRVRVTVELLDPRSGTIIDSRVVENDVGDQFALVDGVVAEAADFLRRRIGHRIAVSRWRAGTTNDEAWQLVQRAQLVQRQAEEVQHSGGPEAAVRTLMSADSLLERAERIDPRYAEPIVQRARIARNRALMSFLLRDTAAVRGALEDGIEHASRATALAPGGTARGDAQRTAESARAFESRASLRYFQTVLTQPSAAVHAQLLSETEADARRAVALDPTRARAFATLSAVLELRGEFAEAAVTARRAYEADGFLEEAETVLNRLFVIAFEGGQDEDAVRWCAEIRRRASHFTAASCQLHTMAWSPQVRPDVSAARSLLEHAGHGPRSAADRLAHLETLMAGVLARAGQPDSARHLLNGVRTRQSPDPELLHLEAGVRVLLGDTLEARELMQRYAASRGSRGVAPLLRASRRFASQPAILRELADGLARN